MRRLSLCYLAAAGLIACGDSGTTPSGGAGGTDGSGGQPTAGSPSAGGAGGASTGGGGSSAGGEGGQGGAEAGINGSAGKGPLVSGSSILVAALDSAGEPTGALFSTVTSDALGNFAVPVNVSGPARIEATGFFFNEILGGLSSAPIVLRALVEVDGSMAQTINVNTLTHLTQKRALTLWQGGASLSDAREQAYAELIAAVEVGAPGFVPGIDAADASLVDGDNDDAAYLLALSSIALDVATVNADGGPVEPVLSQWLDQVATDLEDDGDLAAARKLEIHDSEARIDANGIVTALSDYLVQQGSAAAVPNINRALDQDFDTYANIDDCLPLDPLRWTGNADLDADAHDATACGGDDCNDDLDSISPDEPDSVGDATDNNCDGLDGIDADGDGLATIASGGYDCDDADAAVGPPWQPTYQVGQLAKDAAGNHYGYDGTNVVTDATGTWTTLPVPPGSGYQRLLAESDGTLHLVGNNSHAIYAGGTWTAIGNGPSSPNFSFMVVDDGGALHYLKTSGSTLTYGSNTTGSFVETTVTTALYVAQGIALDSADTPVVCYVGSGNQETCVHPGGTTIFTSNVTGWGITQSTSHSIAIAADDSIYLTINGNTAVYVLHWPAPTPELAYQLVPPDISPSSSIAAVGNDAYFATSVLAYPVAVTNASGNWQALPILGLPFNAQCRMFGGTEPSLVCNGMLYLLNPGCNL